MKSFKYLLLILLVGAGSCKKLLDTKPEYQISPVTYYQTEGQLQSALAAVYDVLGEPLAMYNRDYITRMHNEADEGYNKTVTATPVDYNYSSSNAQNKGFWVALYSGINRANYLLANVNNNPGIAAPVRDQVRGEALFLRSYYYFLLVQTYGKVPLRLTPTESAGQTDVPRSSVREVYERIVADMEAAEPLVASIKTIGHGGRVNKSAVRGMLARVNLFMAGHPLMDASRYAVAATWAKKVIDDTEAAHALNPSFQQVFMNYAQDKYDIKESIWEVEFYGNSTIGQEYGLVGDIIGVPSGNATYGNARGQIRSTGKLYQSYGPANTTDVRRDITITNFTVNNSTGAKTPITNVTPVQLYQRHVAKYRREWEAFTPKASNNTPTNWPLLRYSDVLLMYAEAVNEVSGPTTEAHNALNLVRARASATQFTGATAIATKTAFRDVIIAERSRELAFEALRKQDLIRWGIFLTTMKDMLTRIDTEAPGSTFRVPFFNVSARDTLSPVPLDELTLNAGIGTTDQNAGW